MTAKQQSIITYLQNLSKGVINIQPQHAQDLIEIANHKEIIISSRVEMYQYNNAFKRYDKLQTIYTSDAKISEAIVKALDIRPVEKFIKYELYNSNNDLQGKIYTIDACFFDKL